MRVRMTMRDSWGHQDVLLVFLKTLRLVHIHHPIIIFFSGRRNNLLDQLLLIPLFKVS